MKMQNVPLDQIVCNPWRDLKVYPIDKDHVAELRKSIKDHGFFGGIKARRRNGVFELACGHHRIEAARKAGLDTIPIFVDDMDDDQMIDLMTRENATQGGQSGAAVLADVTAVMRRLAAMLLDPSEHFAGIPAKCFEGKKGFDTARGKLLARIADPDKDGGLGWLLIMRYLGHGDETQSSRRKQQVIEAITTLKQSGRYDAIIDDEIRRHPQPEPEPDKRTTAKTTAVGMAKPRKPRTSVYDDRCSALFPNEHQAQAFREAVTTPAGKQFIPVTNQHALAKQILTGAHVESGGKKGASAPYVKRMVQAQIQEASKQQREIDKEERDRLLREEKEAQIKDALEWGNSGRRTLIGALGKMGDLARQFPGHPRIGGFSASLDALVAAIKEFQKLVG